MRLWVVLVALFAAAVANGQPRFSHPDRIRYDGQCFTIDGHDKVIFSGAFHYFRCPKELWAARLAAIVKAGFNTVETYVPWNYSERTQPSGLYDFSKVDLKDLDEFLTKAENAGLYTIVRPGPYICAEWATGGFPQWLVAKKPSDSKRTPWLRSDDPLFLQWSKHWYDAVCPIIRKHQITVKPAGSKGTILFQIENEYDYFSMPDEAKVNHLRFLAQTALNDGIEVPLFTCWTHQIRGSKDPVLSQVFDTCNEYPRWGIESVSRDLDKLHADQPDSPKMVTELQGGWFSGVGDKLSEEQDGISADQINALTFEGLATGMTASNYYMLFGGTNFGDWAAEGITTSYDYFAPIREWGGLGEKYEAVAGIGQLIAAYGEELARTAPDPSYKAFSADRGLQIRIRKATDGARFIFVRNPSREFEANGAIDLENLIIHYRLPKFGFKVFRLTPDGRTGDWFPATGSMTLPSRQPAPLRISSATVSFPEPTHWRPAVVGRSIAQEGIEGSEFVFYKLPRASNPLGTHVLVAPLGGDFIGRVPAEGRYLDAREFSWPQGGSDFSLLLENPGYPNFGPGIEDRRGIGSLAIAETLPHEQPVDGWKVHSLDAMPQTAERALSEAEGWAPTSPDPGGQRLLDKAGSNAVFRAHVQLSALPKPGTRLHLAGIDDDGIVFVNSQKLGETHDWKSSFDFPADSALKFGDNVVDVYIHNRDGIGGLTGPVSLVEPVQGHDASSLQITTDLTDPPSKEYALDANSPLLRIEHPSAREDHAAHPNLVVRTRVHFLVPAARGVAWEAVMKAGGDGFLKLNGHPLGRYWIQGPQRAFYLPECWLSSGDNVLELTATPNAGSGRIEACQIAPIAE